MNLNIDQMTTEEKLGAMELLWDDICQNVPNFVSPSWHEGILKNREEKIKQGKEEFIDWEQAIKFSFMKIKFLKSAKEDRQWH